MSHPVLSQGEQHAVPTSRKGSSDNDKPQSGSQQLHCPTKRHASVLELGEMILTAEASRQLDNTDKEPVVMLGEKS